jgi:hypothetical protein
MTTLIVAFHDFVNASENNTEATRLYGARGGAVVEVAGSIPDGVIGIFL